MILRKVFVLEIPILKGEPFLLALTPLLKVKIDICTLVWRGLKQYHVRLT